jgi:hypothetical protein
MACQKQFPVKVCAKGSMIYQIDEIAEKSINKAIASRLRNV